ncbi:MAG TPA: hypothetical protein VI968_00755 [archaeon]|nr:hypothetical protein [archaeon]
MRNIDVETTELLATLTHEYRCAGINNPNLRRVTYWLLLGTNETDHAYEVYKCANRKISNG